MKRLISAGTFVAIATALTAPLRAEAPAPAQAPHSTRLVLLGTASGPVIRLERAEPSNLRIPIEAGHGFRREAGHHSGLKPATVPM